MRSLLGVAIGACLLCAAVVAFAGQPLETESARVLRAHQGELELGFEHQQAEGSGETALPFAFGYGLTDRLELLVEPVLLDRISREHAPSVRSFGDLEMTLTRRLSSLESASTIFAIAFEAKLPFAKSPQIGSGRADFTFWGIASRRFGVLDVSGDLGYTLVGKPVGLAVQDVVNFGLATEYHVTPRWELVAEVFVATATLASAASGAQESSTAPEIGGAEITSSIGARVQVPAGWVASFGLSVDRQGALLFHPGLSRKF